MDRTQPWYVRTFDEHYYEMYRDKITPEQTKAEVDGVIARLGLESGAHILDLCCGYGRHSVDLARRGYHVTGLDLSPDLLRHARNAADEAGVEVEWVQADMRDINVPDRPYDAVINMFSALGYLGDDREEAKVAQAVARVLAPGGGLLIETVNREIMLRRWASIRWWEAGDGTLVLDRLKFEVETGVLRRHSQLIRPDGRREEEEDNTRLWSYTELVLLLRAAGFEGFEPFGDLEGARYTWDSYRMVVVARRGAD